MSMNGKTKTKSIGTGSGVGKFEPSDAKVKIDSWWKRGNTRVEELHPEKWLDIKHTPHFGKKLLWSCIGILFIAVAIAGCRSISDIFGIPVGVDAYTAMNIGFAGKIGISLGIFQLIVNLALGILIFKLDKYLLGISSLVNLVCVGFIIDFLHDPFVGITSLTSGNPVLSIAIFAGFVLLFCLGIALYIHTGGTSLGSSPYDAFAVAIVERTGKSYAVIRVVQDVAILLIAWFAAGGPLGIFTFVAAFGTGPIVAFLSKTIVQRLYLKLGVLTPKEHDILMESLRSKHGRKARHEAPATTHAA